MMKLYGMLWNEYDVVIWNEDDVVTWNEYDEIIWYVMKWIWWNYRVCYEMNMMKLYEMIHSYTCRGKSPYCLDDQLLNFGTKKCVPTISEWPISVLRCRSLIISYIGVLSRESNSGPSLVILILLLCGFSRAGRRAISNR